MLLDILCNKILHYINQLVKKKLKYQKLGIVDKQTSLTLVKQKNDDDNRKVGFNVETVSFTLQLFKTHFLKKLKLNAF